MVDNWEVDTVVVGAGLAGLTAANKLTAAGRSVAVLEAGDDVGGRTRTLDLDGHIAELGGEWVGPDHRQMFALLRRYGLHTCPARQLGRAGLWRDHAGASVRRLPPASPAQRLVLLRACRRLDRAAAAVHPVQPWLSVDAERLDAIRFGAWLRDQGLTSALVTYLGAAIGSLTSSDIEDISLLHVLWWVARGNGVLRMLRTTFARVIVEGAHMVSARLAADLGDQPVLDAPVRRIGHGDGVQVEYGHGRWVRARHAVITAPVGSLAAIRFDPGLPAPLAALDELRAKPGTKVVAVLPADHRMRHRFALGGGPLAAAWRVDRRVTGFASPTTAERPTAELVDDLAALSGVRVAELGSPTVYRWSTHTHIPGCDIGFEPGQLTRHGPNLSRSHGPLHFAGAERSSWPNNMEGAVESGVRAAGEILTSAA
ncbi:MAG: FAD-dependent oxidoreductase [Pseudonocardia sp.]|nr:FAD-dependent oxidoreductase [Pseudonocardia sp.]